MKVSSNFFTWDNLIVGVIEEVLWTFQELSQSFGDSPNEESDIVSLLDECLEENSLKDILKVYFFVYIIVKYLFMQFNFK